MSDQHPLPSLRLGPTRVTALPVGDFAAPLGALVGIDPAEAEEILDAAGEPTPARVRVAAFAVETDGRLCLIDAGMGADSPLPDLPRSMARAGLDPAAVEAVLLTHLHPDHCWGLLDGAFPDARVLASWGEIEFARDPERRAAAPPAVAHDYRRSDEVLATLGDRLAPIDSVHVAGIEPVPLPGHSPGHLGFRVRGGGEELLVWGDLVHFPNLQVGRPAITTLADFDPRLMVATRRATLADCAARGTVVAGAHLGPEGFYDVRRDGEAFRLEPALAAR